jgi:hypothetical protein
VHQPTLSSGSVPSVPSADSALEAPEPAGSLRPPCPAVSVLNSVIRPGVTWVNLSQCGPIPRWKRPAHPLLNAPDLARKVRGGIKLAFRRRLGDADCANRYLIEAPWLINGGTAHHSGIIKDPRLTHPAAARPTPARP